MSQYLEGAVKTDTAAGAIAAHLRVKTPGALEAAGVGDFCLGTMEFPCLAAGPASYRLRTAQGTMKMVASGSINKGVTVYAAANGKISAAAGSGVVEGRSLEASTADGDIIEVMCSTTSGAANTAVTGTTSSSFEVASGSSDAIIKIDTDSKTGNYTLSVVPADDLAGHRVIKLPVTNCTLLGDTLAVVSTNNAASALAVGRAGATNPALKVTGAVEDSATGINVTPAAAGAGVGIAAISSAGAENLTIDAKGTGTITIGGTSSGAITITPATTITGVLSAGSVVATTNVANALAVGRAGATNPALLVAGAVASSATGIKITPAAATAGLAVAVISSDDNENLTIDAKGTGTITIAGTSTGAVTVTPATTITGALTSNGGIVMGDAKDVTINNTTGTKIGNHADNKIGFWGVTPVVQQNVIANATNDVDNLMAQLNDVLTLLKTTGMMKAA